MRQGVAMTRTSVARRGAGRVAGGLGFLAAAILALPGCSSDDVAADRTPVSFQVRAVATSVAVSQWSQEAGDTAAATAMLDHTGLDELLTTDGYLAMVDAGCPTAPLAADEAGWLCNAEQSEAFLVFPAALTEADVDGAEASPGVSSDGTAQSAGSWQLRLNFTEQGAIVLHDLTADLSSRNPQGSVAFVVDGVVKSAPVVMDALTGASVPVVAGWTEREAKDLAASLNG